MAGVGWWVVWVFVGGGGGWWRWGCLWGFGGVRVAEVGGAGGRLGLG